MKNVRTFVALFSIAATLLATAANAQENRAYAAPQQTQAVTGDTYVAPQVAPQVSPQVVQQVAPRLGFTGQAILGYGMKVLNVNYHSPAQRAGLEYGDVILNVNEFRIRSQYDYNQALIDAVNHHGGVISLRVKNVRGDIHLGIPNYVNVTAYLPGNNFPVPAVAYNN